MNNSSSVSMSARFVSPLSSEVESKCEEEQKIEFNQFYETDKTNSKDSIKKFDLKDMFGVNVINEIVISYLCTDTKDNDFRSAFENAKSFMAIGHWTGRNDLKLVSQSLLDKMISMYSDTDPEENEYNSFCTEIESLGGTYSEESYHFASELHYLTKANYDIYVRIINLLRLDETTFSLMVSSKTDVLKAIHYDYHVLKIIPELLKNNPEFILSAFKVNNQALEYLIIDIEKLSDKKTIIEIVSRKGFLLEAVSKEFKEDEDVVLAAITNDGNAFKYANSKFKTNQRMLLTAIENGLDEILDINPELMNKSEIILAIFAKEHKKEKRVGRVNYQEWLNIKEEDLKEFDIPSSEKIKLFCELKKLALENVKNYADKALEFAPEMKKDEKFVYSVVQRTGLDLKDAHLSLRKNKNIVLAAVRNNPLALQFASILKSDKEVVLEAVKKNGLALQFASEELRNDREVIYAAAIENLASLKFVDDEDIKNEIINDQPTIMKAVQHRGLSLFLASPKLKKDTEIITEAFKNNLYSISCVASEILNNRKFLLSLISINWRVINIIMDNALLYDKEFIMMAAQIDARVLTLFQNCVNADHAGILAAASFEGMPIYSPDEVADALTSKIEDPPIMYFVKKPKIIRRRNCVIS